MTDVLDNFYYRVENKEGGGPYRADIFPDEYCRGCDKRPTLVYDTIDVDRPFVNFAFQTIDLAKAWFDDKDIIDIMHDNGMYLSAYKKDLIEYSSFGSKQMVLVRNINDRILMPVTLLKEDNDLIKEYLQRQRVCI